MNCESVQINFDVKQTHKPRYKKTCFFLFHENKGLEQISCAVR